MWRILPILVCVIYLSVPACAFSALVWAAGLEAARLPTIYSFWAAFVSCVVLGAFVLICNPGRGNLVN